MWPLATAADIDGDGINEIMVTDGAGLNAFDIQTGLKKPAGH